MNWLEFADKLAEINITAGKARVVATLIKRDFFDRNLPGKYPEGLEAYMPTYQIFNDILLDYIFQLEENIAFLSNSAEVQAKKSIKATCKNAGQEKMGGFD